MSGENILKKGRKDYKFLVFIMIIIMCIGFGAYWRKCDRETMEAPTFKHLSVSEGMGDAGEYASLDVEFMTEAIVIYGNEKKFKSQNDNYHIIVCDGNMYIANIDQSLMNDLKPIIDNTYKGENIVSTQSKRIYGVTQEVTEEFKELAVESYNKIFSTTEDDKMTVEDYEFTFGKVILNTKVDFVDTTVEEMIIILSIIVEIFLFIILKILNLNKNNANKYLKKYGYEKELIDELNDIKNVEVFKKEKVFITKNYLVDIQAGLTVVKFSDIKWMYEVKLKTFGITNGTSMMFKLVDGRTKIQTIEYEKKYNEEFEYIKKKISKKLSKDCIIGNSKKEKMEYKEYKKSL